MNSMLFKCLQVFLWGICAFHISVGVGLNISSDFPQVMAAAYGAEVRFTPEFLYIVKPLGAFMLVLGVMAGAAAMKPLAYPPIVYGFSLLFLVRAAERLAFRDEIVNIMHIGAGRNVGNMIFFAAMGVALFWLFRAVSRQSPSPA